MENTNWIKLMSSSEFAERKKTCDTVIIPVGATEVYGPHMPMGSDIIVAQDVAERLGFAVDVGAEELRALREVQDGAQVDDLGRRQLLRGE